MTAIPPSRQQSLPTIVRLPLPESSIYRQILTYHGAYPFAPRFSGTIDSEELLRAVALLSTKGHYALGSSRKMDGQVLKRGKTEGDWRKILFESFASPIEQSESQVRETGQNTTATSAAATIASDRNNEFELRVLDVLTPTTSRAAQWMVSSFEHVNAEGVRWEEFNTIMEHVMVCLIDCHKNADADDVSSRISLLD
ncbi:MAG: hypothetical protein Q9220_004696 [cf. Caloplaca sp. 1 TL-2023]